MKRTRNTKRNQIREILSKKAAPDFAPIEAEEIECTLLPQGQFSSILPNWIGESGKKELRHGKYHGSNFWQVPGYGVNRWAVVANFQVDWKKLRKTGVDDVEIFRGCVKFLNKPPKRKKFARRQTKPLYGNISPDPVQISFKEDKNKWTFIVSDNGIGIHENDFERIFQPFTRLLSHEEYLGSGFGLNFCKKIIEKHKGEIWVESKLNVGTSFYFTIKKGLIN